MQQLVLKEGQWGLLMRANIVATMGVRGSAGHQAWAVHPSLGSEHHSYQDLGRNEVDACWVGRCWWSKERAKMGQERWL